MLAKVKEETSFSEGPFVVLVIDTPPSEYPKPVGGEPQTVQVVSPEGGFKTKDEAVEFVRHWARVSDADDDVDYTGEFELQIVCLRTLGEFKQYMSW